MQLWRALSETAIGRALIAYFVDLPRWTLVNVLVGVALVPMFLAWVEGATEWIVPLLLPAFLVVAGAINMAAREVNGDAPRWRDALAYPDTYINTAALWLLLVAAIVLLSGEPSPGLMMAVGCITLALLMIGVIAVFLPALLEVKGVVVWRNALVLAVSYPIVALGLLVLSLVAVWAVWISRGALLLIVPALWTMIGAFSVQERITAFQSTSSRHE